MNTTETAAMRDAEGAKLDALESALTPLALAGDDKAAASLMRVMERRSRLYGLDLPTMKTRATRPGVLSGLPEFADLD